MADDERRAEIEAVARDLRSVVRDAANTPAWRGDEFYLERATKIVDRVRDARSDDEAATPHRSPGGAVRGPTMAEAAETARSPQGEDHEARLQAVIDVLRNYVQLEAAEVARQVLMALSRVPAQAEDHEARWDAISALAAGDSERAEQILNHEAGIEAATHVLHGYVWHERLSEVARATVAAYLSRVSPSRDGIVAVEDVRAQTIADVVARLRDHGPVGQVSDIPVTYGAFFADLIEREFSPASTGNREAER